LGGLGSAVTLQTKTKKAIARMTACLITTFNLQFLPNYYINTPLAMVNRKNNAIQRFTW
jgi:hypothetical protein